MSARTVERQYALQQILYEHGEDWYGLKDILSKPSVVADFVADEFWVTVENSVYKKEVLRKVSEGAIIPTNADILTQITQVHSLYHAMLYDSGKIPMIPTYVNFSDGNGEDMRAKLIGQYSPPTVPGIFVRKQSFQSDGLVTAHNAKGLSFLRVSEKEAQLVPNHAGEFVQPFIRPPADPDGKTYVRDIRTYVVDGEPVVSLVRRAKYPLLSGNLSGEVIPRVGQIYSARERGPKQGLSPELQKRVFGRVREITKVLKRTIVERKRPFSIYSPVGFMSIDLILDANGELLPIDCDICPWVDSHEDIDFYVGHVYGRYLAKLAEKEPKKQIVITGDMSQKVIAKTYVEVRDILGESRVKFQQSIWTRAQRIVGL